MDPILSGAQSLQEPFSVSDMATSNGDERILVVPA
jgi:hypothetical protein